MESLNTTIVLDSANTVDELKQARKRKLQKVAEETPPHAENIIKAAMRGIINRVRQILDRVKEVNHTRCL